MVLALLYRIEVSQLFRDFHYGNLNSSLSIDSWTRESSRIQT